MLDIHVNVKNKIPWKNILREIVNLHIVVVVTAIVGFISAIVGIWIAVRLGTHSI